MNHPTGTAMLKDYYKGKLLILDFWATWCSPCVALFPKIDSLQKAFAGAVQFLPVTYQTRVEVNKLWSKSKKLQGIALPMVTADSTLRFLFPHQELPHYVWIDATGKVVAITDQKAVSAVNIQQMLGNTNASLTEKHDAYKTYNRAQPLLFQALDIESQQVAFQSLLTRYISKLPSRMDVIRDAQGRVTRITMVNAWIQWLFALAWSDDTRYFSRNRIVLDVNDPSKLITDEEGEAFKNWLGDHGWCYELVVPPHMSLRVFETMRGDMTRFFPQYTATVETQTRPCLVLVRTSTQDKLRAKGGTPVSAMDAYEVSMTNVHLSSFIAQLSHYLQHLPTPVIDATGYTHAVDLHVQAAIGNREDFRKALHAYDLDLVAQDVPIEVLIIRDAR